MPTSAKQTSSQGALATPQNVFIFLLSFRIANALVVATFFQPDEYFQALEPAWKLAFGDDSGAWMTWEWHYELRSSLHPMLFAAAYRAAAALADVWHFAIEARSQVLLAAPKLVQAGIAAGNDWYTWKYASRAHGAESRSAWLALLLSVVSPWQFFSATRTFSNTAETALTAAALYYWPWPIIAASQQKDDTKPSNAAAGDRSRQSPSFRTSLCLAFTAILLRPTNVLLWIPLALHLLYHSPAHSRGGLVAQAIVYGVLVVSISALSDRYFYGHWTFPPYSFLHYNVTKNIAIFYGSSRPDYYFTEGLPLLLTTSLPFVLYGVYQQFIPSSTSTQSKTKASSEVAKPMSWAFVILPLCLSLVKHKEVRFLYPLVPIANVLAAQPLSQFTHKPKPWKTILLAILFAVNLVIAYYTTQIHQRGVVDVLHYLRNLHEGLQRFYGPETLMTVGLLMPCHSTPWRSHLIHRHISAWALTCEPPIDVPLYQRSTYLDEADQFYADPVGWLQENLFQNPKTSPKRMLPDKLVLFDQLTPVVGDHLRDSGYRECWRTFNSHWHDDWRRQGDVVVWCK